MPRKPARTTEAANAPAPAPATPGKRATIRDVADAAGVSIATISRVVNGEGQVSARTRDRVLAVIDTLRYQPNLAARHMGGGRSKWVALVYQNPGIGFMHMVQSGAIERCRADNYMLSMHACQYVGADLEREVLGIVDQLQPSGLILPPPLSLSTPLMDALVARGVPFVRLCPQEDDHPAPRVWFDDRAATAAMTRLVLAQGHRDLAFITGMPDGMHDPRLQGYLDAVREARLPAAERAVAYGGYTFDGTLVAARQLLQRKRRPSVVVTASDDMAAAVLQVAGDLGLQLPRDLSVTGFDDGFVAGITTPTLTTVHAPFREMGQAAADLLIKGPPDMQAGIVLSRPWRLVQRGSLAAPAG